MNRYSKILHHINPTNETTTSKSSSGKKIRTYEEYEADQKKTEVDRLQEKTEEIQKNVQFLENYIIQHHDEVYDLKEKIKNQKIPQLIKHLNEGLLNEPPNVKNSDPLTPLDQNFVTLNQLNDHYQLFINRIQQQMSTIGGGGAGAFSDLNDIVNFVFVGSPNDLPSPVNGVINLKDNYTYFFTTTVDLQGNRLVAGQNTTILGGSSENCRIKSTGISTTTALLSSQYSLPIRSITLEAPLALNLDATGVPGQAIDWFGVNFTNCAKVGIISSYNNFIMLDSAFLSSQDLTFNGTTGTIGFNQCLFSGNFAIGGNRQIIKVASTANITRRFRCSISSFAIPSTFTGILVENGASIPDESFILETCNFPPTGIPLDGTITDVTGPKSFYNNNRGISNTFVVGQLFMQNNATQTSFASTDTWTKVVGITTDTGDLSKFNADNNRLTCIAALQREYNLQCTLSFYSNSIATASDTIMFGVYDSRISDIREASQIKHTASIGELHHASFSDLITQFSSGDYVEIYCKNLSSSESITVERLNLVVHQLG